MSIKDTFFHSAFSVDNVIFGFDGKGLKILLIKRGTEPYKDFWALPGDLVFPDEDLDVAAGRVLEELTGLRKVYLDQVKSFGRVDRHPLGRVITVAYVSLVKIGDYVVTPASFAQKAQWQSLREVPELAFDHQEILAACFLRLKKKVRSEPVGFELLPKKFTLSELQILYEAILGEELDKRNFRKKIVGLELLHDLGESQEGVPHRPARLYEFNSEKYSRLVAQGLSIDLIASPKKSRRRRPLPT